MAVCVTKHPLMKIGGCFYADVSLCVLKNFIQSDTKHLCDLERQLQRRRVLGRFNRVQGLSCHTDFGCQLRLCHFICIKSQATNIVAYCGSAHSLMPTSVEEDCSRRFGKGGDGKRSQQKMTNGQRGQLKGQALGCHGKQLMYHNLAK